MKTIKKIQSEDLEEQLRVAAFDVVCELCENAVSKMGFDDNELTIKFVKNKKFVISYYGVGLFSVQIPTADQVTIGKDGECKVKRSAIDKIAKPL